MTRSARVPLQTIEAGWLQHSLQTLHRQILAADTALLLALPQ